MSAKVQGELAYATYDVLHPKNFLSSLHDERVRILKLLSDLVIIGPRLFLEQIPVGRCVCTKLALASPGSLALLCNLQSTVKGRASALINKRGAP